MHELSVCASIADIVRRRSAQQHVATIHLRIGQLRQVVPETLEYCWSVLSAGTDLDDSTLAVEYVPARISCASCGASNDVGELPLFMCADCGGVDVSVISGEEFVLTALDLVGA